MEATVETISDSEEILETFQKSGSCIEHEPEGLQEEYAEVFSESDHVHFYRLGDGYARGVELPTNHGESLAVDAVKTGEEFDPEKYRAGVNAVMRHAESLGKDLVIGGAEFFRQNWYQPLDLTWSERSVNPAEEIFFDQTLSEDELEVRHRERPYDKGEQWDEAEEFFVHWL